MKKTFLLFMLIFLAPSAIFAQEKTGALGLWLQGGNSGEYWGVDYKHLGKEAVTDIYLHLSASNNNLSLGLYGGYYFQKNVIKADASAGKFPLYWGPYAGFGYWNDGSANQGDFNGFALRGGVVGGISWVLPTSFPMDISAELNPVAEAHITSYEIKSEGGKKNRDTSWEIPNLYFRILFHAYVF